MTTYNEKNLNRIFWGDWADMKTTLEEGGMVEVITPSKTLTLVRIGELLTIRMEFSEGGTMTEEVPLEEGFVLGSNHVYIGGLTFNSGMPR